MKSKKNTIESCRYVDKVTINYPLIMTEKFIEENKIDLVVHAFLKKKIYINS